MLATDLLTSLTPTTEFKASRAAKINLSAIRRSMNPKPTPLQAGLKVAAQAVKPTRTKLRVTLKAINTFTAFRLQKYNQRAVRLTVAGIS